MDDRPTSEQSPQQSQQPRSSESVGWLRRADQAAAAGLAAGALIAIAVFWFRHGGHRGRMIEIEQVPPRRVLFQVDVNAAGWTEFALLPGIGEQKAKSIVASREAEGPYSTIDDLRRVKGIGPRTVENLRPYLTLQPPSSLAVNGKP